MTSRRTVLVCVIVVAIGELPLAAQTSANGSIRGHVRDEQNAVIPGVTITAVSADTPGTRTVVTDAEGFYRLLELPAGSYSITAELQGFTKLVRENVILRAGVNLGLDVAMPVGSITETLIVKAESPLLESKDAVHAVNVDGELLRALPISERREWFGAVLLAPGVTSSETVNSEKLVYVHGADSGANIVQIDGADVSPALGSTLRYISLNVDAVDDVQIKTAGLDASAPLGVGGIINIATASGTNHLKGAATMFLQPRSWNDSNTPGGTSSTVDQKQMDLSLGAPVVKNRLWVFGAYRYVDVSNGVSRTSAQLEILRGLIPGFEPFDSTNNAHFAFAKINARVSSKQQLEGFYQYDVNPVTFADAAAQNFRAEATGGIGTSVRLLSLWSDRLTTRLGASFNDKRRDGRPPGGSGPLERVYQSTLLSSGRLVGNGRLADRGSPVTAYNGQPNSKLTVSFDATVFANHASGSHELQAGVYTQPRIRNGSRTYWINDGFVYEESVLARPGAYDAVRPFHRLLVDGTEFTSTLRSGQDYAVYVQDAWRPGTRLTINAGLRLDHIAWKDRLFDVTSQRSTELGPRFGINYAFTADTRNIARAHWVRVHDQPITMATSVGTSSLALTDFYDLDLDGTFETTFQTPATFALTPGRTIDPALHQPYIREWGAGFSRQLGGSMTANLDLVHRRYTDRPTLLETNARYEGQVFVGYKDENNNDIFKATNNVWNTPVYHSVELSLTKRTARINAIASYVRQWRHLDGTWQPNDPASFIQPLAFDNNRGIGTPRGSLVANDANSLNGSNWTQRGTGSSQWQDHAVRVGVAVAAPWDLRFATNYTFQSGAWSGPVVTRIAAPDPAFGAATITLSNGRRVSNPLATIFRFAYPTMGEGQLETPNLHVWNLRAGRTVTMRGLKIEASLDVFNVTNNGADMAFESGGHQTFSPQYGKTTFRQLPRSAQLVVRVAF